ncbi:MAG: hypothetical protein KKF80_00875, partial [Candidatus Omnitrophica bacterium]|nr:hypothetical protein [Candidatus Omnitrophota bacterium]
GISSISVFNSQPHIVLPQIILTIGARDMHVSVYRSGSLEFVSNDSFSVYHIFREIEKKFLLAPGLAGEIADRYLSFTDTPHYKEISVKNGDTYASLSTQTFNAFVCEFVRGKVREILADIKRQREIMACAVGCVSQLTTHEGFLEFFKTCAGEETLIPANGRAASASFGCLSYGVHRFLENDHCVTRSLMQKIMHVYSEYF